MWDDVKCDERRQSAICAREKRRQKLMLIAWKHVKFWNENFYGDQLGPILCCFLIPYGMGVPDQPLSNGDSILSLIIG